MQNNLHKFYFYKDPDNITIKPSSLEHGYLLIISEDLVNAKKIFEKLDSPRAKWAAIFTEILSGKIINFPTYFQIRNFMEIDLDFLIKNEKIDYAEQFLGALDLLSTINQETFKYAARVMIANNLLSAAQNYMEKSKQIFYNDAELHFMFAKYYMTLNNFKRALLYINECLTLLPDYYPALKLKEEIEENIF